MDGRTVVDVARVVLQPALFERYWINVYDGVITVGKGDPGKGVVYQWVDSKPNIKIQFVGLSSWDKHVGYRHIQVLPPLQHSKSDHLVDESGGLGRYLESEDLADVHIVVGSEGRTVPTHWLMLHLCCAKFHEFCSAPGEVVHLPLVQYPVLHAMLQYIYTGVTQVGSLVQFSFPTCALQFLILIDSSLKNSLNLILHFDEVINCCFEVLFPLR